MANYISGWDTGLTNPYAKAPIDAPPKFHVGARVVVKQDYSPLGTGTCLPSGAIGTVVEGGSGVVAVRFDNNRFNLAKVNHIWIISNVLNLIPQTNEEKYVMGNWSLEQKRYDPSIDWGKSVLNVYRGDILMGCDVYQTELKTKKSFMDYIRKIPATLKRVLTPELTSQYKANFINGDLALTEKGKAALLDILAQEKQKELAAKAEEYLAEAKEDAENNK